MTDVHVKNTNTNPSDQSITLEVLELGKRSPESVTLGPLAERTFFIERPENMRFLAGEEFAGITFPRGSFPVEAVEVPALADGSGDAVPALTTGDVPPAGDDAPPAPPVD